MRRQIVASQRAGESVTRVAERLLDVGDPRVELPRHVRELRDAALHARDAKVPDLYEQAVQKWQGTIDRLGQGASKSAGEFSIRSATQQLVTDLRRAGPDQVDAVVNRWVLEKARYQARMVARTEVAGAYQDAYRKSTEKKAYVVGYRWTLSASHPRPDICDVLAGQDLHGLGPGGYEKGSTPITPHPNDLCSLVAIIDEKHFRRKLAKARGEPEPPKPWLSGKKETGEAWIKRQPDAFRKTLLGPSRFQAQLRGERMMSRDYGSLRPVYRILKQPKPVLRRGPSVRARPLVQDDRASFVEPFPPVPPVPPEGASAARKQRSKPKPSPAAAPAPTRLPTSFPRPAFEEMARGVSKHLRGRTPDAKQARLAVRKLYREQLGMVPMWPDELITAQVRSLRGVYGTHNTYTGELQIRPTRAREAARVLSKAAKGEASFDTLQEQVATDGLRTLLHEEIHGHTRWSTKGTARTSVSRVVEEATTEVLARRLTRDLLGIPIDRARPFLTGMDRVASTRIGAAGSYGHLIRDVLTSIARHTGETGPQVLERMEQAAWRMRTARAKIAETPEEHLRNFVDGLGVTESQAEAILVDLRGMRI